MDFSQWTDKYLLDYLAKSEGEQEPTRWTDLLRHIQKIRKMVRYEALRRGLINHNVPKSTYSLVTCKHCNVIDTGYFVYRNEETGSLDCICTHCGERA